MRLIDASKFDLKGAEITWIEQRDYAITAHKEKIYKIPTIDAAPVKHGKWEEPEPEGIMLWDKRAYAQCSVCKKKSYLGWKDNYCRYCGAKMDLEE